MSSIPVFTLRYPPADPPYAAMATASLATYFKKTLPSSEQKSAVSVKVIPDRKATSTYLEAKINGSKTFISQSTMSIVRTIARCSDARNKSCIAGGHDLETIGEIETMLQFANSLKEKDAVKSLLTLDAHLEHRSVLCGRSQLTIADCVVWEAILKNTNLEGIRKGLDSAGKKLLMKAKKKETFGNLRRWWTYVNTANTFIQARKAYEATTRGGGGSQSNNAKGGKKNNKANKKEGKKQKGKDVGNFDIPLKGAEVGKVVTRFPPEPSGYMHIGHAKAVLLNDYFAKEWKGKCLLRFDDTNPEKEKQEFVDNIMKDLKTLGINHEPPTTTSDHFDDILKYAKMFIEKDYAYVDDTDVDTMRQQRMDGIESTSRSLPRDEHLRRWAEMVKGSEYGQKCVLRAKISMTHKNKCMRDPAMYRCKVGKLHHKTGDKYKVYPTYDFACPIVDSVEGVTHALRTTEYKDRDEQYKWFISKLGIRPVEIWSYSRLNMRYTVLSKRKLKWFVEEKRVDGWNDPRFPTVQGVMRRGLTVQALRQFILSMGASVNENMMSWDKVWAMNRGIIDPIAHRFLAVDATEKCPLILTNFNEDTPDSVGGKTSKQNQLHPKDKSIGFKTTPLHEQIWLEMNDAKIIQEGEEITLTRWGNCVIDRIEKDANGTPSKVTGKLHLTGGFKGTKNKLTWVAARPEEDMKCVDVVAVEFDQLITKPKLDDGDELMDYLNNNTRAESRLIGEPGLRNVTVGQIIQLERRGFYRCDENNCSNGGAIVLFNIPTGRAKSMSSVGNKIDSTKKR